MATRKPARAQASPFVRLLLRRRLDHAFAFLPSEVARRARNQCLLDRLCRGRNAVQTADVSAREWRLKSRAKMVRVQRASTTLASVSRTASNLADVRVLICAV